MLPSVLFLPQLSFSLLPRRLPAAVVGLLLLGTFGSVQEAQAIGQGSADIGRPFATWGDWENAYSDLVSALDAFAELSRKSIESPARLLDVLQARDRIYRVAGGVEGYIYVRLQLDGGDEEARSRQHLIDQTDRRWSSKGSPWFNDAIMGLGAEQIDRWMGDEEALRPYGFFFQRYLERGRHPYDEGMGELRRLSTIFGQQSSRVYSALAVTEAPSIEVELQSGARLELNPARARTLLWELPDASDRQRVNRAWLEAIGRRSQTYAALLEGLVKRQRLLAEVRGFDSALSAHLHSDGIPASAVREVVRAARESSAPLRRYHSLRKRVLGLDEYGLADRFLSLGQGERELGFDEARQLIVESSSALGPEVQSLVRRAFTDGWIDSTERPGKRVHGGATFVAGHPYVLVSYRGSLDSIFQLAHEIGHAVHASLAFQAQPYFYSHPSSLTSEAIAGIFEGILVARLVDEAKTQNEKIGVLDLSIQNLLRLFYRPMLDADFELRLYETEGPITGPSIAALYAQIVEEFYGDTLTMKPWDSPSWQLTPHYYTAPLYLGRYGLASAAANALVSRLTSPSDSAKTLARRDLLDLMRSGASDYPTELLEHAGIDLGNPVATRSLVARLEKLVGDLELVIEGK